jgi:sugar lactone lactonase YvrE
MKHNKAGWSFAPVVLPAASLILAGAVLAAPALSRADTIYVAGPDGGGQSIERLDSFTGGRLGTFATTSGFPKGLDFDTAGNLYVATAYSIIQKFNPSGVGSVFADTGLNLPMGLAFDSSGQLFVANEGHGNIMKFTPNGVGSVFASTLGGTYGLAFDGAGNLYTANYYVNTIQKFTPDGVGSVFATSGVSGPVGLAIDKEGNLYVANYGNPIGNGGTIEKFTPGGVGSVFATGLQGPECIAFDSADNLYVANLWNATIMKFTQGGVGSVFATGVSTAFMVIQVPEPSVPLLLAFSLPVLLALHYRKTRGSAICMREHWMYSRPNKACFSGWRDYVSVASRTRLPRHH